MAKVCVIARTNPSSRAFGFVPVIRLPDERTGGHRTDDDTTPERSGSTDRAMLDVLRTLQLDLHEDIT